MIGSFAAHNGARLAAALSYYALFSLAPLVIIVLGVAGSVLGDERVRRQFIGAVQAQTGSDIASLIESIIDSTTASPIRGTATIIGTALLLFAATGFFTQLQGAFNVVWSVTETRWRGIRQHVFMRVVSLGMVLLLGLLLLVAVVLQTGVTLLANELGRLLPENQLLVTAGNQLLALVISVLVFGAFFRLLTHVRIGWHEVLVGSLVTSLLLRAGLFFIGVYLRIVDFRTAFGAAGSLVVLLLWIFYSMQIVLIGAEFTRAYGAWLQRRKKQAG
jgi:membrane protein